MEKLSHQLAKSPPCPLPTPIETPRRSSDSPAPDEWHLAGPQALSAAAIPAEKGPKSG